MGVIGTSTIDIHGNDIRTEVTTNRFDEFVIRFARFFGHNFMWRIIHRIEKRKLRKQ